ATRDGEGRIAPPAGWKASRDSAPRILRGQPRVAEDHGQRGDRRARLDAGMGWRNRPPSTRESEQACRVEAGVPRLYPARSVSTRVILALYGWGLRQNLLPGNFRLPDERP